ncbi:hypothetical protein [Streptomyces sp. NPDC091879]|jgi:hypothetical protein|uniref:hypothetical protein n=1 Tax=Streptomyces sp. NPDC091879 TaxID=3366006 RepID=UPI00380E44A3
MAPSRSKPDTAGPQFEQTALPVPLGSRVSAQGQKQTALRAAYHLTKDTPLHLQAKPGALHIGHPTPHSGGMFTKVTSLGAARDETLIHDEERTNYPQSEGQMVMGPPHSPQQFGHLDGHGNVVDTKIDDKWYEKHGPQMSHGNEAFWNKHAKFQSISTSAVLHTGQTAYETGSHSYITGPLAPDHPHVKVVIQGGTPYVADAHHRLAEARGRGDTHVGAHVLNLDQFEKTAPVEPKIKTHTDLDAVHEHLIQAHGMSPRFLEHDQRKAVRAHDKAHREGLIEHRHG